MAVVLPGRCAAARCRYPDPPRCAQAGACAYLGISRVSLSQIQHDCCQQQQQGPRHGACGELPGTVC